MSDRLVDGEPQVIGMEHKIVAAHFNGFRAELLRGFLSPLARISDEILIEDVFPSPACRLDDAAARLEVGVVGRDRGDVERNGETTVPSVDAKLRSSFTKNIPEFTKRTFFTLSASALALSRRSVCCSMGIVKGSILNELFQVAFG